MKRLFQWMLAAILICGAATVFIACTNEDNPVDPATNLSEKIIGKWIVADLKGKPALTNEKMVTTFISSTKAINSSSKVDFTEKENKWNVYREDDVVIVGNKVTLTGHPKEQNTTLINEYNVSSITDTELIGKWKHITIVDGVETVNTEYDIRLVKAAADYREAVLGLWECTGLSGGETYNDANARLEFLADGTYRYYRMDDNNDWQAVTTREFQEYFADGTLLATRWKNQGEAELREWWEIESLSGDQMAWTALRQNPDGSTFQQKMTWKRIDLKVAEKIIGKWMFAERNGVPTPTDKKRVFTFISDSKAYVSASRSAEPTKGMLWYDHTEADVDIDGNKLTLTMQTDEHTTVEDEFIITDINDSEFIALFKVVVTVDGGVERISENVLRYTKVTADYRTAIVGTWQGRCTSEGSVFDDGQEHRWQYKADGTYLYYVKDGNNWVPSENTLNEYFVDGPLLCTRWIDQGQENREWWEIAIAGNKMNWTALRQNPDGTTFTATFEMKKVE